MEDLLTDTVLRGALVARKDLFREDSVFVRFETQDAAELLHQQFDGMQSSLIFGRIVYRRRQDHDETERYSDDLILKRTPSTILMKYFGTLPFHNEAFFYAKMLPFFETVDDKQPDEKMGALFPQYYNSLLQQNANSDESVMVFQNLRSSGFSPPAKKSFLDYDHLRLMMRKLGQFHAYSYRARARNPNEFHAMARCQLEFTGHYYTYYPRLKRCMTRGLEPLKSDPHYSSKVANVSRLIGQIDEVYRNKALAGDESNRTHVVCHGDYIRNNVLFTYDEGGKPIGMKILDLGTWRLASPAFDLAMVLYMNADQSMRDENWDNLLDEYYAAVCRTCPSTDVPTKDSIMAEFKTEAVMAAYFCASYFLPIIVASDNKGDVPEKADLVPPDYKDVVFVQLPPDLLDLVFEKEGGEKATVALANILKDMINRGFV